VAHDWRRYARRMDARTVAEARRVEALVGLQAQGVVHGRVLLAATQQLR